MKRQNLNKKSAPQKSSTQKTLGKRNKILKARSGETDISRYLDALKEYGLSHDQVGSTEAARELQAFVYQRVAEVSDQLPEGSEVNGRVFVVPRRNESGHHKMRAMFVIKMPEIEFEVIGESENAFEAVNFAREATLDQLGTIRAALAQAQGGMKEKFISLQ